MKKLSFSLLAACLFNLSAALAQSDNSGVYLTASDFLHGKLSYTAGCSGQMAGSAVNITLGNKDIIIKQGKQTCKIDKNTVYAIRYGNGRIVRIYKDGCYPILNPGEQIPLYGVMDAPVNKGEPITRKYYFSKDAGSDIQDLTLDNLRAAFPDNKAFQKALEIQLRTDGELSAYDNVYKIYKVNEIYNDADR